MHNIGIEQDAQKNARLSCRVFTPPLARRRESRRCLRQMPCPAAQERQNKALDLDGPRLNVPAAHQASFHRSAPRLCLFSRGG
jgi:hypothetical protein